MIVPNDLTIFFYSACIGTTVFVIQLILNFSGFLDEDEKLFKWLSIQSFAGFTMMFGLTGMTCATEFHMSTEWVVLSATIMGVFTVIITKVILTSAKKLHSSGSLYNLNDVIGKEALVYQRIPKGGIGKVTIRHNEMTYEIEAESTEEIPSFQRVQIIKKKSDNSVVVIPI